MRFWYLILFGSNDYASYRYETLVFWLVSEFWPSTPHTRLDTLDTPRSSCLQTKRPFDNRKAFIVSQV